MLDYPVGYASRVSVAGIRCAGWKAMPRMLGFWIELAIIMRMALTPVEQRAAGESRKCVS